MDGETLKKVGLLTASTVAAFTLGWSMSKRIRTEEPPKEVDQFVTAHRLIAVGR